MTRAAPLADADYDVVIIGGGIAGAGAARDLALRGVSVALLDKGDFGSGTTSKSSKLVHGGLRYLELFDFALVRESLRERETLGRLAPHLVKPLPFLVPVYRESSRSLIKVRLGLKLYDWLTPGGIASATACSSRWTRSASSLRCAPATCAAPATTSTACCSIRSGCAWRTCSRPPVTARASTTTPTSRRSCATGAGPSPA